MSNISDLMNLLFPAARQRVLAVLLLQPQQALHLRELARLTDSHAGTLARELDKLAQAGLLIRSEQRNQVLYQANARHPLFSDLAALFQKTHGMLPAIREALAPLDAQIRLALVFGSVARGTPSLGSDIDLLVLGSVDFMPLAQAVFPLHATLGREVNTVLYTPEEFAARAQGGDAFARDVLAKPLLFVKGGVDELAELAGDRTAAKPSA